MTVTLFCFVRLQIFVWTYIPNYLRIDSDCEIPEVRPDATLCNQCEAILCSLFAEFVSHCFLERA